MILKQKLMSAALVGATLAAVQPASAQTTIEMQQQIQSQLQALQAQMSAARSQQEQQEEQLQQLQLSGQSQPPQDVGAAKMSPAIAPASAATMARTAST